MTSRLPVVILTAFTLLVGCSSASSGRPLATPSEATAGSTAGEPSSSQTVTPSPTPTSQGVTFSIACQTDGEGATFTSWEEAWGSPQAKELYLCDAEVAAGAELSAIQRDAVVAAGYDDPNDITTLAELCVDVNNDYVLSSGTYEDAENYEDGSGPVKEASAMLVLCPNFPKAKWVRARIAETKRALVARKNGTRFDDDVYRINKEIKPETYVAHPSAKGCYWERLNKKGGIIANNFVNAATRVQVTIRSTDYSFNSERCGTWQRT